MDLIKVIHVLRIVYIVYCSYIHYLKLRKRRWWVREVNETRDECGFFAKGIKEMQMKDSEHFFKATRFNVEQFNILLSLLKEKLTKKSRRKAIQPELRLTLTMMYLAQGGSIQVLAWSFKIGISTAREIIIETCKIIWDELHVLYLSPPNEFEWSATAKDFWEKRQMPNCLGAIDGKHVHITCPPKSGSLYYNYKKHHSIVLLAACNANYCFTAVDVGACGSRSDGGILSDSNFGKQLLREQLPIPKSQKLPGTDVDFPYYFVGDMAFPLKRNIMRPFPGRNIGPEKEAFNKRLSRARGLIENTFGILANRWRVLHTKMTCSPKNATHIVLATVVLHNFLMLNKNELYCPVNYVDREENETVIGGDWRNEGIQLDSSRVFRGNRASRDAFSLREILKNYIHSYPL